MSTTERRPIVLVVDDIPTNIQLLGATLEDLAEILVATSGWQALELARSHQRPDLILLDVMMPGMDGYQVCQALQDDPWTRDIPVIFVTARSQEEDEAHGLEQGAVDYVTKPFSASIVRARVRTHLELKRNRDLLERLSYQDGLTGLNNRRRFDEYFVMAWRHAAREQAWLSLLMVDIDYFKGFNDAYGHLAGDECLRRIGGVLTSCAKRPLDIAARYGGEEFALVLPGTNLEGATAVGRRLLEDVRALEIVHRRSPAHPYVTVSAGAAAAIPSDKAPFYRLIEEADKALYEAKDQGRNQLHRRLVMLSR
jgi:diguanylate cyclase (GGDEF)-like protein